MLKTMRNNTKIIIWTVIGSFVLWGGFSVGVQFTTEGQRAGTAFGRSVSFQEFRKFARMTDLFFPEETYRDPEIQRQQTWQNIVYAREARNQGIKVTDQEVRREIGRLLQDSGLAGASGDIYAAWARRTTGMEPREFEELVREMMCIRRLVENIHETPVPRPSEEEARRDYLLRGRRLTTDIISAPDKKSALEIASREVLDDEALERLAQAPELEVNRYEDRPLADLARIWALSPEQMQALYTQPGFMSEPIASGDRFLVFHIRQKAGVTPESFDEGSTAQEHIDKMIENAKYRHFVAWNLELMQRARIQDETAPSAQPPAAS